ncbi:fungal peroxidase [Mycena crocata]|nr:fungal peroxidase [Mycena crocata]
MKLDFTPTLLSFVLCAGTLTSAANIRNVRALVPRRQSSLLINNTAYPELPSAAQANSSAAAAGLNLTNVQGDILIGMRKKKELFYFFGISDATTFKAKLKKEILPRITTTTQLLDVSTQPTTALLNIAFSHPGLLTLNVSLGNDTLGDPAFAAGQLQSVTGTNNILGDPGTKNWVPQFLEKKIHGVILMASDTVDNINSELKTIKSCFGDSIAEIYTLEGAARPGAEEGHEHFGFMDGISNPTISGLPPPNPGQAVVPAGEILLGEKNDTVQRPDWAKDGSFLVFRQLKQLVPEFNKFLADNPISAPGMTPKQGSELLGARMVGRWKSGAPIFLSPNADDPALGNDSMRNNDFNYTDPGGPVPPTNQTKCPFTAHIRKTRPRADLPSEDTGRHIVRGGIPYGPEVSDDEASYNQTKTERGLAFVAYQSNIARGFEFLQKSWAGNPDFVHKGEGFDPIIGANQGNPRPVTGLDPKNLNATTTLVTDFIVSRGGEYFFSPSLSAIANTLTV